MTRLEALRAVYDRLHDCAVVTIMGAVAAELQSIGHRPNFFYLQHAMGLASSVGLGVALARPDVPVVVFDGDGSVLMNLGGLTTLARYRPKNLRHVIFDNESLLSVGGFPTATGAGTSLAGVALAAGVPMAIHSDAPVTPLGPLFTAWCAMNRRTASGRVLGAHERIGAQARRTPVLASAQVDALTGATVRFKCENFQRMGAFKFRGAYNALSQLGPHEKRHGVVAYSSGNHAQAVALAGQLLGVKTTIVMPEDAPPVKLEATRGYGAEIVTYDPTSAARDELAHKLAHDRGLTVIPPFDHPHVVAGQGTAAKELFEDAGPLDLLLVPCGGGGLLSGCALAAKHFNPQCRVIGVEPAAGDDATRSFKAKALVTIAVPDTIADGARTTSLGRVTLPLVLRYVDDMATVEDHALLKSMFFLWERMKVVVEPTGALAACALLEKRVEARGLRVGVVLSGGNVDLAWAAGKLLGR